MKKPLIAVLAVVIIGAVAASLYFKSPNSTEPVVEASACTKEAKMCPDGSSVGRTGPNCEFAACPNAMVPAKPSTMVKPTIPAEETSTTPPNTGVAKYGQKIQINGVSLTPMVVSDDRCPSDAVCASPGHFKLQTRVVANGVTTDQFFSLSEPISLPTATITLLYVSPVPKLNKPVGSNDYRFTFEVITK